jgi:hypothetical protein
MVILEIVSFYLGQPEPQSSYFMFPSIAGITGTYHHAQHFFTLRWGISNSLAYAGLEL